MTQAQTATPPTRLIERVRITRRGIQIALGCIWLLDGLLQFQSFMYTSGFVTQVLLVNAHGQPGIIGDPIVTISNFFGRDLTLWNTLSAEIQCAIGLGLIVSRRSVRPALLVSFGWAFMVWWFGEGFGMLFTGVPVSPLMGAPGAVIVYGLVGLLVWPRQPEGDRSAADGGLLGDFGGQIVWTALWLEAAVLWLLGVNRSRSAIHDQISAMAGASPHWLATGLNSVAGDAEGHGVAIATVLAIASALIGLATWTRLRPAALAIGALLSLAYWVVGQSLGGPFWAGEATDVNTGPLLVLLALTLMPATVTARRREPTAAAQRDASAAAQAEPAARLSRAGSLRRRQATL